MVEPDNEPQDVDAVTREVIRHRLLLRRRTLASVPGSLCVDAATDFASERSSHVSPPTAQQRPYRFASLALANKNIRWTAARLAAPPFAVEKVRRPGHGTTTKNAAGRPLPTLATNHSGKTHG